MSRMVLWSLSTASGLQYLAKSLESLLKVAVAASSGWTSHRQAHRTCPGRCSILAQQRSYCTLPENFRQQCSSTSSLASGRSASALASSELTRRLPLCNAGPSLQLQPQQEQCQGPALHPQTAANPAQTHTLRALSHRHSAVHPQSGTALQNCLTYGMSRLGMLFSAAQQQQCSLSVAQQHLRRGFHSSCALVRRADNPDASAGSSAAAAISSSGGGSSNGSSGSKEEEYEGLQVYLDGVDDTEFQEFEATTLEGEEAEEFDSEWVDGSVINTHHDADAESDLEYDVEFDEAWEDEEEVDDLRDPEGRSGQES